MSTNKKEAHGVDILLLFFHQEKTQQNIKVKLFLFYTLRPHIIMKAFLTEKTSF